MPDLQPGSPFKTPYSPLPCGESRSIRFELDYGAFDLYSINFNNAIEQKKIDSVQSVFVDNTENAQDFIITTGALQQRLVIPAGGMAYLPILAPNPAQLDCTSVAGAGNKTILIVNNFPTPAVVWIP